MSCELAIVENRFDADCSRVMLNSNDDCSKRLDIVCAALSVLRKKRSMVLVLVLAREFESTGLALGDRCSYQSPSIPHARMAIGGIVDLITKGH